jgi:hypothetical protein
VIRERPETDPFVAVVADAHGRDRK